VDYLEDHVPHETYRVRGDTVHVIYHPHQFNLQSLKDSLSEEGIEIHHMGASKVEMEDLFYLHLKSFTASSQEEKSNFRMEWVWPKDSPHSARVVEAMGIRKGFGKVEAVKNSSFWVRPGEIFGIIGSNGAGKTTTLKMLGGLTKPDAGSISLLGQDPMERKEEIQTQLGYMSQHFSLYQDLTVSENLDFYGSIYSVPPTTLKKNIEWILHTTDLDGQRHQKVKELPTGWRQRLALGCTLVHDPRVIFLDEPTSGVDPVTRRYFWHWINFLAHQGRTVVVTTHDMTEAEQCHRVMLLHQGSILALGVPFEICEEEGRGKCLIDLEGSPSKHSIALLQGMRGLRSINPFGTHLHLSFDKSDWNEDRLKNFLQDSGVCYHHWKAISYSIEDVFVERIRGQGEVKAGEA
jgi:ABC-2 type transport system ATP-binding protein